MDKTISPNELSGFAHLLQQEKDAVAFLTESARNCTDLGLKELCEDMAERHQEHCETLLKELLQLRGAEISEQRK